MGNPNEGHLGRSMLPTLPGTLTTSDWLDIPSGVELTWKDAEGQGVFIIQILKRRFQKQRWLEISSPSCKDLRLTEIVHLFRSSCLVRRLGGWAVKKLSPVMRKTVMDMQWQAIRISW